MKILDRYIITKYLSTFLVMLFLFIPIGILVDISQRIDNFKQHEVPTDQILWYYFDFIWFFGNMLFPIFLFLSVIWFTSKMANDTEIIAILSSGISFYRYLRPFVIAASIIAIGALIVGMFIVPMTNKSYHEFRFEYLKKGTKDRQTSNLFKQLNENDYVYVSSYNPNRGLAYNFTYEHFEGNTLQYKISARNIRWLEKDSLYRLTEYFKRTFVGDEERIESKSRLDTLFSFEMKELSPVNYMSQTLNYFELNDFIESERASGSPLINNHLMVRNKRWSLPFSSFVLTIIAVAVASFKRRGGMGINLALGIILAFTYVFFDKVFEVMVDKSGMNPYWGAWMPNLIFGVIAIGLLRYAKR